MKENHPLVLANVNGESSDSHAKLHENKVESFADLVKGKKPYMLTDSDPTSLPDATIFCDEPALDLPLYFTQEGKDMFLETW